MVAVSKSRKVTIIFADFGMKTDFFSLFSRFFIKLNPSGRSSVD